MPFNAGYFSLLGERRDLFFLSTTVPAVDRCVTKHEKAGFWVICIL